MASSSHFSAPGAYWRDACQGDAAEGGRPVRERRAPARHREDSPLPELKAASSRARSTAVEKAPYSGKRKLPSGASTAVEKKGYTKQRIAPDAAGPSSVNVLRGSWPSAEEIATKGAQARGMCVHANLLRRTSTVLSGLVPKLTP